MRVPHPDALASSICWSGSPIWMDFDRAIAFSVQRLAIAMQIIWTKHGEEQQQQWQQKRPDITREAVETVLSYP